MEEYIVATHKDGTVIKVSDIQKRLLSMMKDIDALCRKHDIPYWLCGGSALGAVRHQGFIPWDDDMDIAMLRSDFERFCAVADELPQQYKFQCYTNEPRMNVCVPAKVFLKNTRVIEKNRFLKSNCDHGDCLFIDVFIMDQKAENRAKDLPRRLLSLGLMGLIVCLENLKCNPIWLKDQFVKNARCNAMKNAKSPMIGYSLEWCFGRFRKPVIFPKDAVFPVQRVPFENLSLPIPKHSKLVLDIEISVNHMEYPPKKEQRPKHIKDAWL